MRTTAIFTQVPGATSKHGQAVPWVHRIQQVSHIYSVQLRLAVASWLDFAGETELDTPEVDTSSHFGNTRSRCIKQIPELGTQELGTPELDTALPFQK